MSVATFLRNGSRLIILQAMKPESSERRTKKKRALGQILMKLTCVETFRNVKPWADFSTLETLWKRLETTSRDLSYLFRRTTSWVEYLLSSLRRELHRRLWLSGRKICVYCLMHTTINGPDPTFCISLLAFSQTVALFILQCFESCTLVLCYLLARGLDLQTL